MGKLDRITQQPEVMGGRRAFGECVSPWVRSLGKSARGKASMTCWPIIPTPSARTSCRRSATRYGDPMSVRSSWPRDETCHRHEFGASLGRIVIWHSSYGPWRYQLPPSNNPPFVESLVAIRQIDSDLFARVAFEKCDFR